MKLLQSLHSRLVTLFPWALLLGLFLFQFQSVLPFQTMWKGTYFFDFFTIIDCAVLALAVGAVLMQERQKLPHFLRIGAALLGLACIAQIQLQGTIEPILSSQVNYLLEHIILPLGLCIIVLQTTNHKNRDFLLMSYMVMAAVLASASLLQYLVEPFPGATVDFLGRLTWPYVDFVTLEASNPNWLAFMLLPACVISILWLCRGIAKKKAIILPTLTLIPIAGALFLTQSYGAYIALLASLTVATLVNLPRKHIPMALLAIALAGGVLFGAQWHSPKFDILTGETDYTYDNSFESRENIYRFTLAAMREHPLMGIGPNQFQSHFALHHEELLGVGVYDESHMPPHAHNFLLSMWTNLGLLGLVGIIIILGGIAWHWKKLRDSPALFGLVALMTHGLIDAVYWKQEVDYVFWILVAVCCGFAQSNRSRDSKIPAKQRR